MKNVKSRVASVENKLLKTADTITFEGAKAWSIADKERLMQYAVTGVLGRTFYVSQKKVVDDAIELIKKSDAKDLANAIVTGRNEGYIRTFPILGLVYLSLKDIVLFKEVFSEVIKTGNDLGDFIDLCHSVRGFGRGVKGAINKWLNANVTPYYALKYRKQLADAIRICRIKNDDCIYSYILRNSIDVSDEKNQLALEKYPQLRAFNEIPILLKEKRYDDVAKNISKYRLDVDSLTAYYDQFDKKIWQSIAEQSPVMRFIKYLNKFQRVGIDVKNIALKKITVDNLKKAKVFPFRLFIAWKQLQGIDKSVANIVASTMDDYIKQYDWDKFNKYSWAICPDVSGSMNGVCGNNGKLSYLDIASMISVFMAKGLKNVDVYPWSSDIKEYKVPYADSVITQMNYLKSIGGGGTNMSAALEWMIHNDVKKDFCVFVTDTESYKTKSFYSGRGCSWIQAWVSYKRYNPQAKAIVIRGDCYNNQPMSEDQCLHYDIYQIFGWNDSVISYIQSIVS